MKSLLSLIICIATLLGAAPVADVPQTQTALTLRNIQVCADGTCVDVAPEAKLTVSLGEDQANAMLELTGGEEPIVFALQSEADRMVLVPNSGRMFSAESSLAVPVLTNGSMNALLRLDKMQPLVECLHTILTEEETAEVSEAVVDLSTESTDTEAAETEDILADVFDAVEKASGAQAVENQVTIDRTTVLNGKTVQAELSLLKLFEMLDELAAGTGNAAELAQAGLKSIVKADGSAYESFAEIAEDATEQALPVEQILARGEGVRYDKLQIKPEIEDGEKGVCYLEIISKEGRGASVVFHMEYDDADERFEYGAQIDLQGSLAAPSCIFVKGNMTDAKTPEEGVEEIEARRDDLVLTQADGLWNAAATITLTHTATNEEPVEKKIVVGYSEAVQPEEPEETEIAAVAEAVEAVETDDTVETEAVFEKVPAVIGTAKIRIVSEETNADVSFEILREREAFEDILEPLAEMQLTENQQEIPTMVFGLDLEEMNAAIRALLDLEEVQTAADMLKIDLKDIVLLGEGVTAAVPTETPAPAETEAPVETPEEVNPGDPFADYPSV